MDLFCHASRRGQLVAGCKLLWMRKGHLLGWSACSRLEDWPRCVLRRVSNGDPVLIMCCVFVCRPLHGRSSNVKQQVLPCLTFSPRACSVGCRLPLTNLLTPFPNVSMIYRVISFCAVSLSGWFVLASHPPEYLSVLCGGFLMHPGWSHTVGWGRAM